MALRWRYKKAGLGRPEQDYLAMEAYKVSGYDSWEVTGGRSREPYKAMRHEGWEMGSERQDPFHRSTSQMVVAVGRETDIRLGL
jgi:hypothetical protein